MKKQLLSLFAFLLFAPLLFAQFETSEVLGTVRDATGGVVSVAGVVVGHLWYGRQDYPAYSQAAVGLAATALVSALYPAWRAAQLRPTEAMRKV